MDEVDEKFYRETLCKYYPKKKTSQMRTIESVLNWSLKQSVTS